ncbi:MAG: hypothetical protein H8E84_06785 [Flavobacteriales bacterium]|nr:hypothetical protein [Flavobacteriales bacterium]
MKHLLFISIFFAIVFQSCEKAVVNDGIPSYISIPDIEVVTDPTNEGSSSNKITDAWIYFDNDLQGVYPLPATFPLLLEGKQNISVKAGIKNNGIAATRVKYSFYDYFTEEITLTKDSTISLSPSVNYVENAKFHIIDFESGSEIFEETASSDTSFLANNAIIFEGQSGGVHLLSPHLTFEIATKEIDSLPRTGTPIYVELNYKSNTAFQIGVFANYPQSVITTSILAINPKNEWNKIYIDLTSTIINTQNANSHKVFISMRRDVNSTEMAELYIDNFKIVY